MVEWVQGNMTEKSLGSTALDPRAYGSTERLHCIAMHDLLVRSYYSFLYTIHISVSSL